MNPGQHFIRGGIKDSFSNIIFFFKYLCITQVWVDINALRIVYLGVFSDNSGFIIK